VGAGPVDPFTTTRKTYAEGMRYVESGLPAPDAKLIDNAEAFASKPTGRKDRRRVYRRLPYGAVRSYAPICVDSNDPDTVFRGFIKRVLRPTPRLDPELLREFSQFVSSYLQRFVPASVPIMSFEEWLDSTHYDDERKSQLRSSYALLGGSRPTKRQCSHVDSFVKTESYDEYKFARLINSRCDAFKAWSGPFFKSIERVLYPIDGDVNFVKHIPPQLRGTLVEKLI